MRSRREETTRCDTSHMKVERNSLTMVPSLDLGVDFTERGKPESLEKNPQSTGHLPTTKPVHGRSSSSNAQDMFLNSEQKSNL